MRGHAVNISPVKASAKFALVSRLERAAIDFLHQAAGSSMELQGGELRPAKKFFMN